jgi:hypothetical protein
MVTNLARHGFTLAQAIAVAEEIGIDFSAENFGPESFRRGMEVELEHGRRDPRTNVTNDDPMITGKITWAHLLEMPDYYERLEEMEAEAEHEG